MNGWSRVPNTRSARIRVEDYLRNLGHPRAPYVRVLRFARLIEVHGEARFASLAALDLNIHDLRNDVNYALARRTRERELAARPSTHRLLNDGSLRLEDPRRG